MISRKFPSSVWIPLPQQGCTQLSGNDLKQIPSSVEYAFTSTAARSLAVTTLSKFPLQSRILSLSSCTQLSGNDLKQIPIFSLEYLYLSRLQAAVGEK